MSAPHDPPSPDFGTLNTPPYDDNNPAEVPTGIQQLVWMWYSYLSSRENVGIRDGGHNSSAIVSDAYDTGNYVALLMALRKCQPIQGPLLPRAFIMDVEQGSDTDLISNLAVGQVLEFILSMHGVPCPSEYYWHRTLSVELYENLYGNPDDLEEGIRLYARRPRYNSPPESPMPGDSEDSDDEDDSVIVEGQECTICTDREITIQFHGCPHAACTSCTRKLWWSRVKCDTHFPTWFPCPLCRAEISLVGWLLRDEDGEGSWEGDKAVHGGVELTIWSWHTVKMWIAQRSPKAGERLEEITSAGTE